MGRRSEREERAEGREEQLRKLSADEPGRRRKIVAQWRAS